MKQQALITKYVNALVADSSLNSESTTLDSYAVDFITCYTKIQFLTGSGQRLAFFLSPDHKFLSTDLFDITKDLVDERRKERETIRDQLNTHIEDQGSPIYGSPNAAVTVVVFADFQCPFCAQAIRSIAREILPEFSEEVRMAIVNVTSSGHKWSLPIAKALACVGFTEASNFWLAAFKVLDSQSRLDESSAIAVAQDQYADGGALAQKSFELCQGSQSTTAWLARDQLLSQQLGIDKTPTVFVEGARLEGFRSSDEVKELIRSFLKRK